MQRKERKIKTRAVIGLRCPGAGGKAVVTFSTLQGTNSSLSRCFPSGPEKGQKDVYKKTKRRESEISVSTLAQPPLQNQNTEIVLHHNVTMRQQELILSPDLPAVSIKEPYPPATYSHSRLGLPFRLRFLLPESFFFMFSFSFLLTDCREQSC